MTHETPQRQDLPVLGDPDDNGGDFATEHRATTVDNVEEEAAGPATLRATPPVNGDP
jgi:hypothetical protein